MKITKHIRYLTLAGAIILAAFSACEIDEPFPDPSGDFKVWAINDETNAYEQIPEPYQLISGKVYDYVIEGTGQQFVIWFGVAGEPGYNPTGSDFNDRYMNHLSKGTVATGDVVKFSYRETGTYEIVLVASSYSYTEDKYKESLTRKTVTVVATEE